MRQVKTPRRIPRKLKKNIIKLFGRKSYFMILNDGVEVKLRMNNVLTTNGWKSIYEGWSLFKIIR